MELRCGTPSWLVSLFRSWYGPRCVVWCSLALPYGAARPTRSHFQALTVNIYITVMHSQYAFTDNHPTESRSETRSQNVTSLEKSNKKALA